jgi:tight adherence protein C
MANNSDKNALSWATGDEPDKSKSNLINFTRPLVHQFTLKYAIKIKNENYRKKLQYLILTAGLSRELNVDEFIGLQILWGVLFPVVFAIMNFGFDMGMSPLVFVLISFFGVYGPQFYARQQKAQREVSVRADLPFFADLLALSTEAGLDFISALQKIADKAVGSVLADEFAQVLQDIRLGSARAEALRGLAHRIDIQEIISFVAVIIDADATGASISQVLKDQSVQIRMERFVRAEKAGARASQMMLIPMMMFILPAVFIVVMGPVILQFFYNKK